MNNDKPACPHCLDRYDNAKQCCPAHVRTEMTTVENDQVMLEGTMTLTYRVDVTRAEAIELLVNAGADEAEVKDLSMSALVNAMLNRDDSDFADDVRQSLEDYASETDSSGIDWELY